MSEIQSAGDAIEAELTALGIPDQTIKAQLIYMSYFDEVEGFNANFYAHLFYSAPNDEILIDSINQNYGLSIDYNEFMRTYTFVIFQSTPSVWRETLREMISLIELLISIHSLRVEGDTGDRNTEPIIFYFNPLPPCGGRRPSNSALACCCNYFNPLPPCGGRPTEQVAVLERKQFQSTPSVWRETQMYQAGYQDLYISIHSLRVEGDRAAFPLHRGKYRFQSTPSVWRETDMLQTMVWSLIQFQSTPSVWRETLYS